MPWKTRLKYLRAMAICTWIQSSALRKDCMKTATQTTALLIFLVAAQAGPLFNKPLTAEIPPCAKNPDWPVCVKKGLIPREKCLEFIDLVEEKYTENFLKSGNDSLDNLPAMQLDILENGKIQEPFEDLYHWLEPYLETLKLVTTENFDTEEPYWVYLKRYSDEDSNHGRTRLRIHSDASKATAIVGFTRPDQDYKGGKYQIFHRNISLDTQALDATVDQVMYPHTCQGCAILHDGALRHRVEEVTKGWRYSLIIFYPFPSVKATFTNNLNTPVSVYWVNGDEEMLESQLQVGGTGTTHTYPDHWFVVKVKKEDSSEEITATWQIYWYPGEQDFYTNQSSTTDSHVQDIVDIYVKETEQATAERKKLDNINFDFQVREEQPTDGQTEGVQKSEL